MFRLAQLLTVNEKQPLEAEIAEDMKKFLSEIENEDVDLKSIGVRGKDKKVITSIMYQCYGLSE